MTTEKRLARNDELIKTYKSLIKAGVRITLAKERVAKKYDLSYISVHKIISGKDS